MILGFTGTRKQPTQAQLGWVNSILAPVTELHHGACVGSDEAMHSQALIRGIPIVVHPPTNTRLMMEIEPHPLVTVLPPQDYHSRNRAIVQASRELFALPDGPEREGSGTWYTINFARDDGLSPLIVLPDGTWSVR